MGSNTRGKKDKILCMVCKIGQVQVDSAGGESILTRVTQPKGFLHDFVKENSNSSILVVEIDQVDDYILDFHK
jgi:hypothetical protein